MDALADALDTKNVTESLAVYRYNAQWQLDFAKRATTGGHIPDPYFHTYIFSCSCAGLIDVHDGPLLPNTRFLQGTSIFQIQDLCVVSVFWLEPHSRSERAQLIPHPTPISLLGVRGAEHPESWGLP